MNSNDAKTRYNRVILKVNIFSKSSKKQPFSNLFKLIWNLSIDKEVVLMAGIAFRKCKILACELWLLKYSTAVHGKVF